MKKVPLHGCINQFPGQHLFRGNTDISHCLQRSYFIKEKHFVIPLCFQKTRQWERKDQGVEVERTNSFPKHLVKILDPSAYAFDFARAKEKSSGVENAPKPPRQHIPT